MYEAYHFGKFFHHFIFIVLNSNNIFLPIWIIKMFVESDKNCIRSPQI